MTGTIPVTCDHCQHGWETTSEMRNVTCPSCQRKTRNPKFKHD